MRINHDARADIGLEYCIKMIATNQLNEQDFDFEEGNEEILESSEDSHSEASAN